MKKNHLIISTIVSIFISCKKEPQSGFTCRDKGSNPDVICVAYWSYFRFTVVDEKTGADLLFGSNPTLSVSDIKLFGKSNSPYTQMQFVTDTNKKQLYTMGCTDTMALQIKDEPLQYILVKSYCGFNQVCSRTAVEILHEGKLVIADESGLIRIKR